MGASTVDNRDIYYRQAKAEGYRARSAFKLLQLDEIFGLFFKDSHALEDRWDFTEDGALPTRKKPKQREDYLEKAPTRVVDLCAAPGSWSQVLVHKLPPGSRIVSVDLQPMAPIPGVTQILGDITTQETADAVVTALRSDEQTSDPERGLAEMVICDGAPDVTGVHDLDEFLHAQLMLAATQITFRILQVGGTFIAKIFTQHTRGNFVGTNESGHLLRRQMKDWFEHVDVVKPSSSRPTSVEHFLVCRGFRPPFHLGFDRRVTPNLLDFQGLHAAGPQASALPTELQQMVAMTACGDLSAWDGSGKA